jgi:hypothetical protein
MWGELLPHLIPDIQSAWINVHDSWLSPFAVVLKVESHFAAKELSTKV